MVVSIVHSELVILLVSFTQKLESYEVDTDIT